MNLVTARVWRPLRWLLLLLCLGGAVLAADNSWLTSLRVGQMSLSDWLARFTGDWTVKEIVLPTEPAEETQTTSSTNTWLNTTLFSQPATGWTLDSSKKAPVAMMQAQSSGTVVQSNSSTLPSALFSSGFVSYSSATFGPVPTAPSSTDGTWISSASGNWGTSSNWASGVIADGSGANAHFDTLNITTNVTVTLDTSRTIGNLYIGDTDGTHSYSIDPFGGSSLTFDSASTSNPSVLQQSTLSAGDTIAVPILIKNDLYVNNLSAGNQFHITGNIASSAGTGSFQTIAFNSNLPMGSTPGTIRVTGNITNGTTGANVSVSVEGGTVIFEGTNTYAGGTSIFQSTLLVNGDNSGATGNINVFNTGTLGGTGAVAGDVLTFGGVITGGTAGTVGTLTLTDNLRLATGEGGGTYLADLSGSMSDLLAITGMLILGEGSALEIQGMADGTTTYILATFSSSTGAFDAISGVPGGYTLVLNPTDLELVPIPEPATWIGAALALGAIAFTQRRRLRALL